MDFGGLTIKHEQPTYVKVKQSLAAAAHECCAAPQRCQEPRAIKRDGSLDELCATHRSQAKRKDLQRKRLLRVLVDALKPENERDAETTGRPRRRPRLVLLGNQQTLILGVVLSEQGDLSGIARSML